MEKRVGVYVRVQFCKGVVHISVRCLIGSDAIDYIFHFGVVWLEFVITDCNGVCLLHSPQSQMPFFPNILQQSCISLDSFFLQVAHKSVTGPWRNEISKEKCVEEDPLTQNHHHSKHKGGVLHLHKN
jgi:hypothetical protein